MSIHATETQWPSDTYHPRRNVYQINSQNNFSGNVTHYMTRNKCSNNFSGHAIFFYRTQSGQNKITWNKTLRIVFRSCNALHDFKQFRKQMFRPVIFLMRMVPLTFDSDGCFSRGQARCDVSCHFSSGGLVQQHHDVSRHGLVQLIWHNTMPSNTQRLSVQAERL